MNETIEKMKIAVKVLDESFAAIRQAHSAASRESQLAECLVFKLLERTGELSRDATRILGMVEDDNA